MKTIHPADAHERPMDYLDQLCREFPRIFACGGTQADVDTLFGGVATALKAGLEVSLGTDVEIRMFPLPEGPWAHDYEPEEDLPFDLAKAGVDLTDARPDFRMGDALGLIFVPDTTSAGWQRWNPAAGPAPKPADGHMVVTLVLLSSDGKEVTFCRLREIFGRDKSLRAPLYKPAVKLAPASAAESAHLVDTLRSLLGSGEES